MRAPRTPALAWLAAAAVAASLAACGGGRREPDVWIPPRVELAALGRLGMLEFSAPPGEALGALATREFLAAMQRAQPGTPVLELGRAPGTSVSPDAVRALGQRHGVDAIVVGQLDAQRVAPRLALDAVQEWLTASAQLEGALSVRILDAHSGATLWSTSVRGREELARVDLSRGAVSNAGAKPADGASERLVRRLVSHGTVDFWGHWE